MILRKSVPDITTIPTRSWLAYLLLFLLTDSYSNILKSTIMSNYHIYWLMLLTGTEYATCLQLLCVVASGIGTANPAISCLDNSFLTCIILSQSAQLQLA